LLNSTNGGCYVAEFVEDGETSYLTNFCGDISTWAHTASGYSYWKCLPEDVFPTVCFHCAWKEQSQLLVY